MKPRNWCRGSAARGSELERWESRPQRRSSRYGEGFRPGSVAFLVPRLGYWKAASSGRPPIPMTASIKPLKRLMNPLASRRTIRIAALSTICFAVVATLAIAARGGRDLVWTHPDYARTRVDRIALIPAASFDNNLQNESLVEAMLGQSLKGTSYRWISASSTRELLRSQTGNDSLLKLLKSDLLKDAKIDSVHVRYVCKVLKCSGLLGVRIDQWDQQTPDYNQAGTPTTTVQARAALSDSLGRVIWTISGGLTAEGGYYDPSKGPVAVKDSGLERQAVTGSAGAPPYREVLTTLFGRWAPTFPPKPAAPAVATSADSSAVAPAVSRAPADSAASH